MVLRISDILQIATCFPLAMRTKAKNTLMYRMTFGTICTQKAQGELIAELQAQRQNEIAKQCSQVLNSNTEDDRILIRSNVIRDLTKTVEISGKVYNHSKIERAVDHVMKLKNNAHCTEDELAAKAYKWLIGTESDKRNTPKSKSKMDTPHIEIRDLLEACTYSPKA